MKGTPFRRVLNAQRMGKTALMNQHIEEMLDKGETVYVMSNIPGRSEVRGAGVARDITPPKSLRIEKK